ncbi:MAG: geranylgeranyl reductase family protein [Nitrospirae bacterium]|nr:geranylgeranyl reductase family protein [Nitrospirota bacterium]
MRTKVLVVGGGPAGSTAARFLTAEGLDTILVERNPFFVKPCGGGLPSTVFDELGIPKEAIKKEIKKIRIVSPRGAVLDIGLKGGCIAIVKRGEFDSILRKEAQNTGARLIQGEFISLEEKNGQIIAKVNIDGNEEYIKTDYLIAADGVNSRVRLSLGVKHVSFLYTISAMMAMDIDSCEFWFGSAHAPNSYSWLFPAAEGVSSGTAGSPAQTLKSSLKSFFDRRGLDSNPPTRIYRIPLWDGELYNKSNIFFAGDSAGHVMPLTYEGIYHAMKAGEFAARAIISGKPSDYKKLWKKRFHTRFFVMKKLCDYFLRDDSSAEKMISLYKRPEIQEVSMKLWLEKSSGGRHLISFMNLFKRILS